MRRRRPSSWPPTAALPGWPRPLAGAAGAARPEDLSRFLPPEEGGRASAVLMLFAGDEAGGVGAADVLLIERSHGLRSHAGQVAFPRGGIDPDDDGPVGAELR